MIRIFKILMIGIVLCPALLSQEHAVMSISDEELWLSNEFMKLYEPGGTENIDSINNQIITRFQGILKSEESFFYPWTGLKMIGKVKSEDQRVNIFTWYTQKRQNDYEYYGILQFYDKKDKHEPVRTYFLKDESANLKNPETIDLTNDIWYGALYYGMRTFIFKKKTFYVLLGFDFHDAFSDKKLIEVLTINKNHTPSFGGVFQMEFQKIKRVIFEFSGQVVMTLRYDDRLKLIVFDHLSPVQPMFTNNYRFYSPDGSYDAFKFEKGAFVLKTDVDARNE